jgi:Protein of unknown function (DUF2934)
MAKAKRRRTDNVFPMAAVEQKPVTVSQSADVTHVGIARRAHELYLSRGSGHGHDLDDWLQAEGELRAVTSTAA